MFEKFLNQVVQGDCLELFKSIPDASVDITFADPPFNLNKKYNTYKDNVNNYLDWCEQWINEMVRVTKPTDSIFLHNIPKWLTFYTVFLNKKTFFKHWIAWEAPTSPMGKTLQPSHYGVLFYAKNVEKTKFYEIRYPHKRCRKCNYLTKDYGGKKHLLHPFGPLVSDVWNDLHRIKHNKYRNEHPCQLPIHLLERIILMSTDENDVVLDPFSGTGTSLLAAKRLGRKFIGFELDKKYVEFSQEKILQENYFSKINGVYVSIFLNEIVTLRDKDWEKLAQNYFLMETPKELEKNKIFLKPSFQTLNETSGKPKKQLILI